MSARVKILLLFVLVVAPALLVLATAELSFQRAETLAFCSSCHTMTPWVKDLENPESDALAARHYRNRWIAHDQCYTCHVDYDFFGPVEAKIDGVHHILAYYTGIGASKTIQLYKPYPNENCLQCHRNAASFLNNHIHQKTMTKILANELSCIKCHGNMHTPET